MKDEKFVTPPIIFRYEERIAELEKENDQSKREVKKWMDRYKALYSEGYSDILKENRELKRINTLLEENTVKVEKALCNLMDDYASDLERVAYVEAEKAEEFARETAKQIEKIRGEK